MVLGVRSWRLFSAGTCRLLALQACLLGAALRVVAAGTTEAASLLFEQSLPPASDCTHDAPIVVAPASPVPAPAGEAVAHDAAAALALLLAATGAAAASPHAAVLPPPRWVRRCMSVSKRSSLSASSRSYSRCRCPAASAPPVAAAAAAVSPAGAGKTQTKPLQRRAAFCCCAAGAALRRRHAALTQPPAACCAGVGGAACAVGVVGAWRAGVLDAAPCSSLFWLALRAACRDAAMRCGWILTWSHA